MAKVFFVLFTTAVWVWIFARASEDFKETVKEDIRNGWECALTDIHTGHCQVAVWGKK